MNSHTLKIRRVPVGHGANTFHNVHAVKLVRETNYMGLREATRLVINAAGDEWQTVTTDGDLASLERKKARFEELGVEVSLTPSAPPSE